MLAEVVGMVKDNLLQVGQRHLAYDGVLVVEINLCHDLPAFIQGSDDMLIGPVVSNLVEAKQKVQGLLGNKLQFLQVILDKKQLKMKVKGT